MQWVTPEAMQCVFIRQLDRDEGMTVRGGVVHSVAHPLNARNLHQQVMNIPERSVNDFAIDARLDSQDDIVPNHAECATFPYHVAPGVT